MENKIFSVNQIETLQNPSITQNTCYQCKKSFAYSSSLIKHMRIHTGEKPYTCRKGCNQKFSQISNLIRHERIHSGDKPYMCEYCHKSFTSSSNLKQHMNIHQNQYVRKKYVCFINECEKGYLYICTLKKHIKKYHQQEYKNITDFFKNENFILIYKNLHENHSLFPFINFKSYECLDSFQSSNGNFEEGKKKNIIVNNIFNNITNNNDICNTYDSIIWDRNMTCVQNVISEKHSQNIKNIKSNTFPSPLLIDSFISYLKQEEKQKYNELNGYSNISAVDSFTQSKKILDDMVNYFSFYNFYEKLKEFQYINLENFEVKNTFKPQVVVGDQTSSTNEYKFQSNSFINSNRIEQKNKNMSYPKNFNDILQEINLITQRKNSNIISLDNDVKITEDLFNNNLIENSSLHNCQESSKFKIEKNKDFLSEFPNIFKDKECGEVYNTDNLNTNFKKDIKRKKRCQSDNLFFDESPIKRREEYREISKQTENSPSELNQFKISLKKIGSFENPNFISKQFQNKNNLELNLKSTI